MIEDKYATKWVNRSNSTNFVYRNNINVKTNHYKSYDKEEGGEEVVEKEHPRLDVAAVLLNSVVGLHRTIQ